MRTRTIVLGYGIGVLMAVVFFATVEGKMDLPIALSVFLALFSALIVVRFWN